MNKAGNINIGRFNTAQGILIIIVIIHHTLNTFSDYGAYQVFSSMNNPFLFFLYKFISYGVISSFFVISGIGFHPLTSKKRMISRCGLILRPYIMIAVLIIMLNLVKKVLTHASLQDVLISYGIPYLLGLCPADRFISGRFIHSIGPIWFLLSMLEASVLLTYLLKVKNKYIQTLLVLGVVIAGYLSSKYLFLPFCLSQSCIVTGYLFLGRKISEYNLLYKKTAWYIYAILLLFVLPVMTYGAVNVSSNIWKLGILDISATGIVAFLYIRVYLNIANHKNFFSRIAGEIGRYSFWILCIHTVEVMVFPWHTFLGLMKDHVVSGILAELMIRTVLIYAGFKVLYFLTRKGRIKRLCFWKQSALRQ